MSGSNSFLIHDENIENILTDAQYLLDDDRLNGVKSGMARSNYDNKVLRQCSIMTWALGELIKSKGNVASDASSSSLYSALLASFPSQSDWSATSGGAVILNKPNFGTPNAITIGRKDALGNANILSVSGNTLKFYCNTITTIGITNHLRQSANLSSIANLPIVPAKCADALASITGTGQGYTIVGATPAEDVYGVVDKTLGVRYRSTTGSGSVKITKNSDNIGRIVGYKITGNYEPALLNRSPKSWVIKDVSGNIIDTRTNETGWTAAQVRTYWLNTPVVSSEFFMDSIVNNGSDYLTVNEISILVESASGTIEFPQTQNVYVGVDASREAFNTPYSTGKIYPTNPITNQVHYLTSSEPAILKKWDGSQWANYDKVLSGQVTTNSSGAVVSVVQPVFGRNNYDINVNTTLSTGTNLAKSITDMCMPDYTKGVSKTYGGFTAAYNGLLQLGLRNNTNTASSCVVNGVTVAADFSGAQHNLTWHIPLGKGDICTWVGGAGSPESSAIFYPLKGGN